VSVPRILNPGAHVVVLDVGGQRTQNDVTLGDGEAREIEVNAPQGAGGPAVVTPPPPVDGNTTPPSSSTSSGGMSPLVPIGFGVAGVGLAVGAITGIITLSTASTVKDSCKPDGRCPASAQSDLDSAKTTGTISTIGFAVGLAGAAVGVIGIIISKPSTETPRTGFRIVPTIDGVAGTF
jgi:hypothetical protein